MKHTEQKKILKDTKKKTKTYKNRPIRITAGIWMETLKARSIWVDVLPSLKIREPTLLYKAKL